MPPNEPRLSSGQSGKKRQRAASRYSDSPDSPTLDAPLAKKLFLPCAPISDKERTPALSTSGVSDIDTPTKPSTQRSNAGKRRQRTPKRKSATPLKTPQTAERFGLSQSAAKKLQKYVSSFPNLMDVIMTFQQAALCQKTIPTVEENGTMLLNYTHNIPEKRTYSTLTQEDKANLFQANNVIFAGGLKYNSAELTNGISVLDSFWEQVDLLTEYNDISTEAGCRQLIGLFLLNAVRAAKQKFKLKSIAMFSKVAFSFPNLPGIGPISGPVDYLTASLDSDIPLRYSGGRGTPTKPLFLVVEAKREQTIADPSSGAQLMAQLLTAHFQDTNTPAHSGVLTDGLNWEFYTFHSTSRPSSLDDESPRSINLYATERIVGVNKTSKMEIFGLLTHFTGGFIPTAEDHTIWIDSSVV